MEPHPASLIFPLMDGVDLARLVDDIRERGLAEPIVLLDGQILDGRNRLRACELAGVEPRFVQWDEPGISPLEWVVRRNLQWRRLTNGQKAALALDLLPQLEKEAKERQRLAGREYGRGIASAENGGSYEDPGEAGAKAADLVGIGRTAVKTAKAIQKRDPDVVNRMRAGEISIARAAREVGYAPNGSVIPITEGEAPVYYGKGDKWREATEPLRRYLKAWAGRDYEFRHINPREAVKRLAVLDELAAGIEAARADLESRSTRAQLHVDSR